MTNCPHCGMIHQTTCPRIKSIEYNDDGATVKRIEFHAPQAQVTPDMRLPFGAPASTFLHVSSGLANACEQDEGA